MQEQELMQQDSEFVDLGQYIGKKYKLEKFRIFQMSTKLLPFKNWYMKLYTETIIKIQDKEVRASVLFPMKSRYTWKAFGKLQFVMDCYHVATIAGLIGKEVEITRNTRGWLEWRVLESIVTNKKEEALHFAKKIKTDQSEKDQSEKFL